MNIFRNLSSSGSSKNGSQTGKRSKPSKKQQQRDELEEQNRKLKEIADAQIKMIEDLNKRQEDQAIESEQKQILILEEKTEELARRRGMVMDKTEQGGGKIDFTQGTMGLVDRLEAHRAGTLLKNVVISNEPPPDRELNVNRLRRFKPQNDFSKLTLGEVPAFNLTDEFMEFSIVDAMTSDQLSSLKDYVLVSDVFIHYVPLDSFYSISAPVLFQLNDFRKVDNTCMRQFPLTHSASYNILMTLDYCVSKRDLHHLSLSISTSLNSFRKGVSWGSAKVILTISHMDFPVKANIQETMGVLHLADSDLQEFVSDPRSSDGVITPQALSLLRGHYKRGEVENINLPRDDSKQVNTAKTIVDNYDPSVDARDIMSELRKTALMSARDEDKPKPRKSSMKKTSRYRNESSTVVNDDSDDLGNLEEINIGDSFSNEESEESIELPRTTSPMPKRMSSVNFPSM